MERHKKEKMERQTRLSLKTINNLMPTLMVPPSSEEAQESLLSKTYPQISQLNSLRILTVLQIIYILEGYLELLEKHTPSLVGKFKIGIIGGGITGRLVLNSILPLTKDGLLGENITVSTRQAENFKWYSQHFGVRILFDNELAALESDFLVVCTPATLDNWIIKDLRESLEARVRVTQKKNKLASLSSSLISKVQTQKSKAPQNKNQQISKEGEKGLNLEQVFPFKPLVYITTSDFHEGKSKKVLPFPVLTPSIRAKDLTNIKQALEMFTVQTAQSTDFHQKILAWWLLKEEDLQKKGFESGDSQSAKEIKHESIENSMDKYSKTPFFKVIKVLSFVVGDAISAKSVHSSLSNTVSVCESIKEVKRQENMAQIIEVFSAQGEVDQTLFKKIRKWQMAYNNYVA